MLRNIEKVRAHQMVAGVFLTARVASQQNLEWWT